MPGLVMIFCGELPATSFGFTSLKSTVRAMPGASTRSRDERVVAFLAHFDVLAARGQRQRHRRLALRIAVHENFRVRRLTLDAHSTSSAARRASSVDSLPASANISRVHGA